MWNTQLRIHPNRATFILCSGVCVTPGLCWLILYLFSFSFFHVGTKDYWVVSPLKQQLFCPILLSSPTILPPLCPSSTLWGPLLRAIWCHPLPGVARLLQRLPELWVGHWGWTGTFHQDQLWQVCMTVLQQLSRGNKDTHTHRFTKAQTETETAHNPLSI